MKIALLALCAASAFGQPATHSVVVQLANTPSATGFRDIAMMLRLAARVQTAEPVAGASEISLTGTSQEIGVAQWLLHAIDKPTGWQPPQDLYNNPSAREYVIPEQPDRRDLPYPDYHERTIRVFYMRNATSRLAMQEAITQLRIVALVRDAFAPEGGSAVIYRTTADTANLAEWCLRKLDIPADGQAFAAQQRSHTFETYQAEGADDFIRFYYLKPDMPASEIARFMKQIRDDIQPRASFPSIDRHGAAVRGTTAQMARVDQLMTGQ